VILLQQNGTNTVDIKKESRHSGQVLTHVADEKVVQVTVARPSDPRTYVVLIAILPLKHL